MRSQTRRRPTLRERFEENYIAVPTPADNRSGVKIKYMYYAPWYIWDLTERRFKREKAILSLLSLVSLALYCFSATRYTGFNTLRAVSLLGMAALCAHVLELSGLMRLLAVKSRTTKLTFETVDGIMGTAPLCRCVLMLLTGVTSLFGMSGERGAVLPWVTALLYFICAALALAVHWRYGRIPHKIEPNELLKTLKAQGEDNEREVNE